MNTSRLIGLTLLSMPAVFAGCKTSALPTTRPDTTPFVIREKAPDTARSAPQQIPEPGPIITSPPVPGTAQALAQRAATYAQAVEPVIRARPGGAKATPSDWPDPQALYLTPRADGDPATPARSNGSPEKVPQANASVSIPVTQHLVASGNPPAAPGNAAPAAATAPLGNADGLDLRFAGRAKDYPADLSAQVDDQLLKFLRDAPVGDMQSLAGLIPEDRELLSALMDSLSNFRNQLRSDNNMLFSRKIRPLVELADRLRSQAELTVPTVALCTSVKTFGVYDPIDPARFIAGKEQRVVVYCEVENFLAQPNEKSLYETRLTQDIVLYTESSGLPVWTDKRSTYVDQARRRRHDFFLGKIISLPATLTIGRYLLKVTVEDQQARHIAENTVPIEIVAQ